MAKAQRIPPRPYMMPRFGILNPYGEIWSVNTFDTEEEGRRYLEKFWDGNKHAPDLTKFKIAPVNVTITVR